jgi:hypothetical protein
VRVSHDQKLVVHIHRRESIQRVSAVSLEVPELGRGGKNQRVQIAIDHSGTNRMESRSAVLANGGKECETGTELIEEFPFSRRHFRCTGFKVFP